jgi:hypothetical protein
VAKRERFWFGLTDEDVGFLRGWIVTSDSRLNKIDRILISLRYTFFSRSPSVKNFRVKCDWPRAISGWVTDRKVFSDTHE